MCVAMVIIYTKTLEKKGVVDDVRSKKPDLGLCQTQTMSQGTALFSCGLMETRRWRDLGRGCAIQQSPVGSASLESLWDVLPEVHQSSAHWERDAGAASGTISSLLQDLTLTEAASSSATTAPPSKRQCRSLSCSDELGGCRVAWRPQGSRVWTAVEKRRCHSGGSVQRGAVAGLYHAGFPAMQRSSSFSLPARSNTLELPCFTQRFPCPSSSAGLALSSSSSTGLALTSSTGLALSSSEPPPSQPLYLSHEQICLPELHGPYSSPPSSPDSTPELERRSGEGGLARSRSQPCVLNDKKIGMKRRRPSDTQKQRPSLDLAKMTQKLRNFHSLSCPGITGQDCCQSSQAPPTLRSTPQCETDFTPASDQRLAVPSRTKEGRVTTRSSQSDPTIEELDWSSPCFTGAREGPANGKERESLWAGLCSPRKDVYQLGGELDIEQIERN